MLARQTTDRLTADAIICGGPSVLYGIAVETNGTNIAILTLYDNTSASGKIIRKVGIPGASLCGLYEFPVGLYAANGIYADVSGTGAAYWVTFSTTP